MFLFGLSKVIFRGVYFCRSRHGRDTVQASGTPPSSQTSSAGGMSGYGSKLETLRDVVPLCHSLNTGLFLITSTNSG